MSQKDKQLLLADLCARLPYGVKVRRFVYTTPTDAIESVELFNPYWLKELYSEKAEFKPYLRSMDDMAEEEKREYKHLIAFSGNPIGSANLIDWLNKKMFAYRTIDDKDMFELGLAIKVTKDNNPYKE